jgi:hypothetical protein
VTIAARERLPIAGLIRKSPQQITLLLFIIQPLFRHAEAEKLVAVIVRIANIGPRFAIVQELALVFMIQLQNRKKLLGLKLSVGRVMMFLGLFGKPLTEDMF